MSTSAKATTMNLRMLLNDRLYSHPGTAGSMPKQNPLVRAFDDNRRLNVGEMKC